MFDFRFLVERGKGGTEKDKRTEESGEGTPMKTPFCLQILLLAEL